ncbi:hypothetical protein ElyMa_004475200 [Elysia marginata]|uniref:DDE Tnp4 domain-containing protein n=1 Tax=Elysia marginata TaxID=1093978 RepID=A0AAV4HGR8_9GAST|nr:hypothetical protein ElyMa_004475200 [Elysia marginata]
MALSTEERSQISLCNGSTTKQIGFCRDSWFLLRVLESQNRDFFPLIRKLRRSIQRITSLWFKNSFPHVKDFILKVTFCCLAHKSRSQTIYYEKRVDIIAKDDLPLQSPDLDPMDYAKWNTLSEKVYIGRSIPFSDIAKQSSAGDK